MKANDLHEGTTRALSRVVASNVCVCGGGGGGGGGEVGQYSSQF